MRTTDFIKWNNLQNIPFRECRFDANNSDFDIYQGSELVLTDYNHVGHYLHSAVTVFKGIKNKRAEWVNLKNLWTLRNCIRENHNHWLDVDSLIYDRPLTKRRFLDLIEIINQIDPYATL